MGKLQSKTAVTVAALGTLTGGPDSSVLAGTNPQPDEVNKHVHVMTAEELQGTSFGENLRQGLESSLSPDEAEAQKHLSYTVRSGDSLARIARNELGLEALWPLVAELNKLSSPYQLQIGQEIALPTKELVNQWCQQHGLPRLYTVETGDSLSRISKREFGTEKYWKEIADFNNLKSPYVLQAGQTLRLPSITKYQEPQIFVLDTQGNAFYVAARALGDARRYVEILALNPELDLGEIERGAEVRIRPGPGREMPSLSDTSAQLLKREIPLVVPSDQCVEQYQHCGEFIKKHAELAREVERLTGVPSEVVLAQAALETGWGRHPTDGNNYFGIKANGAWQGNSTIETTHEEIDGKRKKLRDSFRAYGSVGESFQNYAAFISTQTPYRRAFQHASPGGRPSQAEIRRFIDDVAKKWASDTNYASQLKSMLRFMKRER